MKLKKGQDYDTTNDEEEGSRLLDVDHRVGWKIKFANLEGWEALGLGLGVLGESDSTDLIRGEEFL